MPLEIADDAVDLERRVLLQQGAGRRFDDGGADVEGDVADEAAVVAGGVEEEAGLGRRPGAQLDHLVGTDEIDQL